MQFSTSANFGLSSPCLKCSAIQSRSREHKPLLVTQPKSFTTCPTQIVPRYLHCHGPRSLLPALHRHRHARVAPNPNRSSPTRGAPIANIAELNHRSSSCPLVKGGANGAERRGSAKVLDEEETRAVEVIGALARL